MKDNNEEMNENEKREENGHPQVPNNITSSGLEGPAAKVIPDPMFKSNQGEDHYPHSSGPIDPTPGPVLPPRLEPPMFPPQPPPLPGVNSGEQYANLGVPTIPGYPLPPSSAPNFSGEGSFEDPSRLGAEPGFDQPESSNKGRKPFDRVERRILGLVIVAALIGALVGAGVSALVNRNSNSSGGVVTIRQGTATAGPALLSGNVSIPQLVNKVLPATVSIDVKALGQEDEGTGMIISSNGYVITNNHVIELYVNSPLPVAGQGRSITVTESGTTKTQTATLVGYDTQDDVALLKINGASGLPTISFGNSNNLVVGDSVVAIGNALGLAAGTPTVTQGIISALGRTVTASGAGTASETLTNMIQTDAAINPGNSGGPLIDSAGQVIGMNTAVAGATSNGTSAQNIGFAIPIDRVQSLIPILQKGGPASNGGGFLGVSTTTLTSQLRQEYGFTPTSGAIILSVVAGSPAFQAGLQQGDIITAVDGTAISSATKLASVIGSDRAGQKVSLTFYIGNERQTVSATLVSQAVGAQLVQQAQSGFGGLSIGGGRIGGGALP